MASFKRDDNRVPVQGAVSSVTSNAIPLYAVPVGSINAQAVAIVDSSGNQVTPAPIGLKTFDYMSLALSNVNTTETYTFKVGGSGGTTTNTIVIDYTDSSRTVITDVTKT